LNAEYVECDLWRAEARATMEPARMLAGFDLPPIEAARSRLPDA
jgi:hypothetical protein